MKKEMLFGVIVCIFSILLLSLLKEENIQIQNTGSSQDEYIIFMKGGGWDGKYGLYYMSTTGTIPTRLVSVSGTFDWSWDKKIIAAGCKGGEYICIYDATKINPDNHFPILNGEEDKRWDFKNPIATIPLPSDCLGAKEYLQDRIPRFISISKNNKKIGIVCRSTKMSESRVCIMDISGEYSCWNNDKDIVSIAFSPVAEELIITEGEYPFEYIYLTDIYGKRKRDIGYGWSPSWTNDGKQIAYFVMRYKNYEDYHEELLNPQNILGTSGIIIYDVQKKSEKWALINNENEDFVIYSHNCADRDNCRLSWSKEQQYLFFSSTINKKLPIIFKLNVENKELVWLTDWLEGSLDPVWGELPVR